MNDKKIYLFAFTAGLLILGFGLANELIDDLRGYSINPALAVSTTSITVSATVGATVSCDTTGGSPTDFGSLTSSAIGSSSPMTYATTSCTYGAGCEVYASSTNSALYCPSGGCAGNSIASADETLTINSDGYGIQAATTTDGTGEDLQIATKYYKDGDTVGKLELTNTLLSSAGGTYSGNVIRVTYKASIDSTQPGGSYSDLVSYACVGL